MAQACPKFADGGARLTFLDQLTRNPKIRAYLKRLKFYLRQRSPVPVDPRSGWIDAAAPLVATLAKDNDFIVSTFGPEANHLIANDIKSANPTLT